MNKNSTRNPGVDQKWSTLDQIWSTLDLTLASSRSLFMIGKILAMLKYVVGVLFQLTAVLPIININLVIQCYAMDKTILV